MNSYPAVAKTDSPSCPEQCPGCPHRHMHPRQSEERKMEWLGKQLFQWKEVLFPVIGPPVENRFGYREKTCLSAGWTDAGWVFGLMSRMKLIPIPDCPVHSHRVRRTATAIAKALPAPAQFPLKYYVQSGAQVTLVLKSGVMPDISWLKPGLEDRLRDMGIQGIWLHLFPSAGKKVFAKTGWHLLWGSPSSRDADGFLYGPASFQQVFPGLHKKAMDETDAFFSTTPDDMVIDLYCGIGRTLRRWTDRKAKTIGVELSGEAVECARQNAPDSELLRGGCAQRIVQLDQWLRENQGDRLMIYANPPRTGLESPVIEWIAGVRPRKFVYMSCSPGTLARDLEILCKQGFSLKHIRPYDFFPRTRHVEVLATSESVKVNRCGKI